MELFNRRDISFWIVVYISGIRRSLWIKEFRRYQGELEMVLRILFCFIWILL